MLRRLDQMAAVLVSLIGVVHLAVGWRSFVSPTASGVWFVSAGFLLVTAGLINLSCARGGTPRLQSAAALSGGLAIVVLGGLIAAADPDLLMQPQTLILLTLGVVLTVFRFRDLAAPGPRT